MNLFVLSYTCLFVNPFEFVLAWLTVSEMEKFRIRADELREDELQYEVELRCGPYTLTNVEEGRRLLRNWLRSETDNDDEYPTNRSKSDEYWSVLKALQEIENHLRSGRTVGARPV